MSVESAHAKMSAATVTYVEACSHRDTEYHAYAEVLGVATHAAVTSVAERDRSGE
jgi:hypothetical protein